MSKEIDQNLKSKHDLSYLTGNHDNFEYIETLKSILNNNESVL